MAGDCVLCRGAEADAELMRIEVWSDDLWRLTTGTHGEILGFSYLEPKRHIPYITELDGEEARTFGEVLAKVTSALRDATQAEVVYIYVFGTGVPHLHLHLVPHREGDAANEAIIKGELVEEPQPSGVTIFYSKDYPPLPEADSRAAAERIRALLAR